MSLRKLHVAHLALGALFIALLPNSAHALPRLSDGMEPIEIADPPPRPIRPLPVPTPDPKPAPVPITERIQVDPDPEAFPESGVQHPAFMPLLFALPAASTLESQKNVERSFGNDTWGGGYRLYSNVRAPSPSYQSINHETNIWGKLFSKRIEAFKLTAATWNPRDDYRSSRLQVYIAGAQIFDAFQENPALLGTSTAAFNRAPVSKTLLSVDKTFTVGPVPITVKGSIGARFGANEAARAYRNSSTTSGVSLSGDALAEAYARLSAAVGVSGFSAGVRGTVDLVNIKPVINIRVDRNGNTATYNNDFNVHVGTLNGFVEVFAEFLWKEWSKVILDWDGYQFDYVMSHESGSVTFGGGLFFQTVPLETLQLAVAQ